MAENLNNFQKRDTKNSQSNYSIGLREFERGLGENIIQNWKQYYVLFQLLEQNKEFKEVACRLALWEPSGGDFMKEYMRAYLDMGMFLHLCTFKTPT